MNMQIIIAVVFFVLAIVISYAIKILRDKKIKSSYRKFADANKLNFTFESFLFKKRPELTGEMGGHNIYVFNSSDGSLEASKRYYFTLAEIDAPQLDIEFSIGKENFLKEIGEVFCYQDIKVNSGDLDKQFVFKSNKPEEFKKLVKQIDVELFDKNKFGKYLFYKDGKFTCKMRGVIKNSKDFDKLKSMMKICFEIMNQNNN